MLNRYRERTAGIGRRPADSDPPVVVADVRYNLARWQRDQLPLKKASLLSITQQRMLEDSPFWQWEAEPSEAEQNGWP